MLCYITLPYIPSLYEQVLYRACAAANKTAPWCPTKVGNVSDEDGFWGFCEKDSPLDNGMYFFIT
jgi:hypothetical protein